MTLICIGYSHYLDTVQFVRIKALLGFAEGVPFLGVTERATRRLLLSNADTHAADIVNRDRLGFLRGTDFDALIPEDFTAICKWLGRRPAVHPRAAPRPDQWEALREIERALRTQTRATVVMPCGTGKTLVQLWAAEQQRNEVTHLWTRICLTFSVGFPH